MPYDKTVLKEQFLAARKALREIVRMQQQSGNPEQQRDARKALNALRQELLKAGFSENAPGILPPPGGYRDLQSYRNAEIIYDATVAFCPLYIDRFSRTNDQMVQAARSGKQNIAEGSAASGTSKKTELKLMNVARASLEELLLDYEDFLRQHNLPLWDKDNPQAQTIRKLAYNQNRSYRTYKSYIENSSPETAANTICCLIHQTNFLLNKLVKQLEAAFLEEGGFTERLYHARKNHRKA